MPSSVCARLVGLSVWLLVFLGAHNAWAQQTCYGYDETGRLIAAVNQQGQTVIYDHDAVGNVTSVRRNDATGPVAITFATPTSVVGGSTIVLLGTGFSSDSSQDHVSIGGTAATVTAANTCSLTVMVPPSVPAGIESIQVTTPSGSAMFTGGVSVGATVLVAPATTAVAVNQTIGFFATVAGIADQRVTWRVNGITGGDAVHGTITSAGLYTAPAAVPTPITVAIQAVSVANPSVSGQATASITAADNQFATTAVSVMFGPLSAGGANAAPVSVVFDAAAPPLSVVALPVSVQFGPLPPGGAEAAPVSVSFGALPGRVVQSAPVSVANAAVVTNVAPGSAAHGAAFEMTVTGANLTGATALAFLVDGAPDAQIGATNISVSTNGTQLTADVSVGAAAITGAHVVVVQTAGGTSGLESTGSNGFGVSP